MRKAEAKPSKTMEDALEVLQRAGWLEERSAVWLAPLEDVPDCILEKVEQGDEGVVVTVVRRPMRYQVRGPGVELRDGLGPGSNVSVIARSDGTLVVVPWKPSLTT